MSERQERDPASNQLKDFHKKHGGIGSVTTSSGNPIWQKDASLTVGKDGNILLEDWDLLDELSHFERERIPERVVHAKGGGAFGKFVVTHDITQYTMATVFSKIGKATPIGVRFSTVAGNLGSADTARDPRGFAVKFYTEDGIWDLVGNNTPIFFVRDPIMFPQFIHSQKRNPVTHLRDWDAFWDFFSLRPESMHQLMILFSDRGTPDGFRHMHGYGSHTFTLVNAANERTYCKFHYKTDQGIKNLDPDKADVLAGIEPDYAIRDLFNAIARGESTTWTLYIQVMTEAQAASSSFNPFDVTKVWPHGDYPLIPVGKLSLDRNPENYFAEIEQIAFSPASMIPGIYASRDRMLLGRLFSYHDSHIYRLGVNYSQLPVNCPFKVRNFQRDGLSAANNQGGAPNYHPNSYGGPDSDKKARKYYPVRFLSGQVDKYDTRDEDNFSQPAIFYNRVLCEEERARLIANIVGKLKLADVPIQKRNVSNFYQVDKDFGRRVENGLKPQTRAKM